MKARDNTRRDAARTEKAAKPATRTLLFRHTLLREAALSLVPDDQRARLHALAAELLAAAGCAPREVSAHACEAARAETAKWSDALWRGAEEEAARDNPAAALKLYEQLSWLEGAPIETRCQATLRALRLLERSGRHEAAMAAAQRAVALADSSGLEALRGSARVKLGGLLRRRGQCAQALPVLLGAEDHGRAAKDLRCQAESVIERGLVHSAMGEHGRAEECFVAAERLFRHAGDLEGVCRALGNLAGIHEARGQLEAALAVLGEAGELAEILNHALIRARLTGNRANVLAKLGDVEGAREAYALALRDFAAVGDRHGVAATHANVGTLLERQGDLDAADIQFAGAARLAAEIGDALVESRMLSNRGVICARRSDFRGAHKLYGDALTLARACRDTMHECRLLENIARALRSEGRLEEALGAIEAALEIAHTRKFNPEAGVLYALKAQALLQMGRGRASQEEALRALDWCEEHGLMETAPHFEALIALVGFEKSQGNLKDAQLLARDAQDLAVRLKLDAGSLDVATRQSLQLLAEVQGKAVPKSGGR